MQSGNGDDVIDAGASHRLVDFIGNAGPHADDQRRRDLTLGTANRGPDVVGNGFTGIFYPREKAGRERHLVVRG
ncbi:hypothetical protein ACVILI_003995 [Mesorhizobium sp. USDA 4775]